MSVSKQAIEQIPAEIMDELQRIFPNGTKIRIPAAKIKQRKETIKRMTEEGCSTSEIAKAEGITTQTVRIAQRKMKACAKES